MVRAILAGTKTQTRRPIKAAVAWHHVEVDDDDGVPVPMVDREPRVDGGNWERLACPLGEAGDTLWVRECFSHSARDDTFWYRSDFVPRYDAWERDIPPDTVERCERWTPSIHMPRYASRIDLRVTAVRVERVQDISERDACADGGYSPVTRDCKVPKFAALWNDVYGTWDANPWVWAITFEVVS